MNDGREVAAAHEKLPEGEEQAPRGVRTMSAVRWILIALMALAAVAAWAYRYGPSLHPGSAASVLYHCPMHPSVVSERPGECPICGMDLVPIDAPTTTGQGTPAHGTQGASEHRGAYTCPMHPEFTSDDPEARCPECGMKLVPRSGAAPSPAAVAGKAPDGLVAVELNAERVQLLGMKTATVVRAPLASSIRAVGYVTPSEDGLATISTRFGGWIEELAVSQTGQHVAKGQVLATIYSPELLAAEQEYINALTWSAKSAGAATVGELNAELAASARRRLELLGISEQELQEIERSRKPVRALRIRSPVAGHVITKGVLPGTFVQPATELFTIADLSKIWVLAEVHENQASQVRLGQSAKLSFAAYPAEAFAGSVTTIYPTMSAETRTLRVRIELDNRAEKLRPGMYGDVMLAGHERDGLVVPSEAVVDTGREQYVFTVAGPGRFEPRRVQVGARDNGLAQVLSGLQEGEIVVTTGNFLIDSESRLRAALEGFAAPAPAETANAGHSH
jgi:membrane fusion protein, copper/silver efflux system